MWLCPHCGEEIEEQFDQCWKCGTARSGSPNPSFRTDPDLPAGGNRSADADLSTSEAIAEILRLQREQTESLAVTRTRVGCLFAWMVLGSVVGVLYVFLVLSAGPPYPR